MGKSEFEIIKQYFNKHSGNGDDAADITPPACHTLVTSTDTSIAGKHFRHDTPAKSIGHKSLAVSLSDIAAMGAQPTHCLLNLTIPNIDDIWLEEFSHAFFELANQYSVQIIGGDTTSGPLSITTTIFGIIPKEIVPLWRYGAKDGDLIAISGQLGDAAYALNHPDIDQTRLYYPQPRVELGLKLRSLANSCIDISDGLAQDLMHILQQSNLGAHIYVDRIPCQNNIDDALNGGDDYELCFTIPKEKEKELQQIANLLSLPITVIGEITQESGLKILDKNNNPHVIKKPGFQHF